MNLDDKLIYEAVNNRIITKVEYILQGTPYKVRIGDAVQVVKIDNYSWLFPSSVEGFTGIISSFMWSEPMQTYHITFLNNNFECYIDMCIPLEEINKLPLADRQTALDVLDI